MKRWLHYMIVRQAVSCSVSFKKLYTAAIVFLYSKHRISLRQRRWAQFYVSCRLPRPDIYLGSSKNIATHAAQQTDIPFLHRKIKCVFFRKKTSCMKVALYHSLRYRAFARYFTGIPLCLSNFTIQHFCIQPFVFEFTNLTNINVLCNVSCRSLCDVKVFQFSGILRTKKCAPSCTTHMKTKLPLFFFPHRSVHLDKRQSAGSYEFAFWDLMPCILVEFYRHFGKRIPFIL
jgi:hypothetical protein